MTQSPESHPASTARGPQKGCRSPRAQARVEGNTLVVGANEFRVMPETYAYSYEDSAKQLEGAPEGEAKFQGMSAFVLPSGWAIVSREDPDFDIVQEKVIKAYGWSSYQVAVHKVVPKVGRRPEYHNMDGNGFTTYNTKNSADAHTDAGSQVP